MTQRPMLLRGTWYPQDLGDLRSKLCGQRDCGDSTAQAIIVPHAGLRYSGKVANEAYAWLQNQHRRILLLAPSHHAMLRDTVGLPSTDSAETPFSTLRYAVDAVEQLSKHPNCKQLAAKLEFREHSVEMQLIQLGHIQRRSGIELSVLPLIVGTLTEKTRVELADAIKQAFPHDLVIITTDLSHYGVNYGWGEGIEGDAALRNIDEAAFGAICSGHLQDHIDETGNTICGREPLLLGQRLLGEGRWHKLAYARSSISASYDDNSVGYLAAVFTQ